MLTLLLMFFAVFTLGSGLVVLPVVAIGMWWLWFHQAITLRNLPEERAAFRKDMGKFALQELRIGSGCWVLLVLLYGVITPEGRWYPLLLGVPLVTGVSLATISHLRKHKPLPEWLFPLKGRWLHGFLLAAALGGLLLAGPWFWACVGAVWMGASIGLQRPPLLWPWFIGLTVVALPAAIVCYTYLVWRLAWDEMAAARHPEE